MSFDPDNIDHEVELENDNEQIIKRLDAIIYLLEIVADQDHGSAIEIAGEV